jgi:hypothetical protein
MFLTHSAAATDAGTGSELARGTHTCVHTAMQASKHLTMVPCLKMAQVSTQHIGNHRAWAVHRNDFICKMLLHRNPVLRHGELAVKGVLAEMRQVQPQHAPLLIQDVVVDVAARAQPIYCTVVV